MSTDRKKYTENYDNLEEYEAPKWDGGSGAGSKKKIEQLANDIYDSDYSSFVEGEDYAALAKRYSDQGRRAMDDTVGQVAARTGGLASSYAASVGQQAYGSWMEKLEDAARSLYDSQMSEKVSKLGIAQGIYDRNYGEFVDNRDHAYGAYRDSVGDAKWADEQGLLGERFNYQKDQDAEAKAEAKAEADAEALKNDIYQAAYYGTASWEDFKDTGISEAEFNRIVNMARSARSDDTYERDAIEKEQAQQDVMAMWAAGVTPTTEQLQAAGWYDEAMQASEDGSIPAGLNPLGQAYYKGATYVKPEAPTELTTYMSGLPVMRDRDGEEYMAGMVYYGSDGKTYELPIGSNPYANGKINRDLYDENGKLDTSRLMPGSNYQPNGIKVDGNYEELSATGYEANFEDGSSAPIYKLDNGWWYYWSDAENAYNFISEEDKKKIMGGE